VLHWWALVDVIGCNLHNRCDSRTFDRTKLNMFNPCDPGRNRCRMYGCTCSCSCMFVYTVRSSWRSVARSRSIARPIATTIASCKHRVRRCRAHPASECEEATPLRCVGVIGGVQKTRRRRERKLQQLRTANCSERDR